jgi:hypothetical protein
VRQLIRVLGLEKDIGALLVAAATAATSHRDGNQGREEKGRNSHVISFCFRIIACSL